MAETAKKEVWQAKPLFLAGDCISVPPIFFGQLWSSQIPSDTTKIYGRVKQVFSNRTTVCWDIDSCEQTVSCDKLTLEDKNTPTQFFDLESEEQTSSSVAAETHVIVVETDVDFQKGAFVSALGLSSRDDDGASSDSDDCVIKKKATQKCRLKKTTKRPPPPPTPLPKKLLITTDKEATDSEKEEEMDIENKSDSDDDDNLEYQNLKNKARRNCKRRTTKKQTIPPKKLTVIVGKKAADRKEAKKMIRNQDNQQSDGENILDYEEEDTQSDQETEKSTTEKEKTKGTTKRLNEEQKYWKDGNWRIDKRKANGFTGSGPKLNHFFGKTELDYFFHFFPQSFIREKIIPAINKVSTEASHSWVDVTFTELIKFLGIIYSMEVLNLPNRKMYWATEDQGFLKAPNYGQYMTRQRFDDIMHYLQFSDAESKDTQILDFILAVNQELFKSVIPGDILVLDESMVKSFHRNLKGKIKIIRKPRPIGNEFKNVCDGRSCIVMFLELYEGKEYMREKQYTDECQATTATCLRLTENWKHSGRLVIGDSWFGSVTTSVQLMKLHGLHSIMLVKTAHSLYPKEMFKDISLKRGEWSTKVGKIDDVDLMAVKFVDLQPKQFISTSSVSSIGPPRETKHHGLISRPQVAFDYLSFAAGIDIHNHVRNGSTGFEDAWLTKNPHCRQFAGILGFLFTNAYLAKKHFSDKKNAVHSSFKIELANAMLNYVDFDAIQLRRSLSTEVPAIPNVQHKLMRMARAGEKLQKPCFYCRHGFEESYRRKTSFYCASCGVEKPICSPEIRECWENHMKNGMPKKRRLVKK